jgi:hypothetical protein
MIAIDANRVLRQKVSFFWPINQLVRQNWRFNGTLTYLLAHYAHNCAKAGGKAVHLDAVVLLGTAATRIGYAL